jgi:von Willebrand factor type D domain
MKVLSVISVLACTTAVSANKNKSKSPIGECDVKYDCDKDKDCAAGLLCADAHKKELKKMGYDERSANCKNIKDKPWNWELCFPQSLLTPSGGGGGDPHFRTYDGTKYSYHGQCDLVMARSPTFDSGLGLHVHARTEIVSGWSLISNAAIRIGDDTLEVVNDGSHYFNGQKDTILPVALAGKYWISRTADTLDGDSVDVYTVSLENDEKIVISTFKSMISVRVDAALLGTEGMLGLQSEAGLIGRDRTNVVTDANKMGQEWQVRDTEPMLFNEIRAPQYPAQCILPEVSARRMLRLSEEEMKKASTACSMVSEDMRSFCIDDVIVTGDHTIAHQYGYSF